jgi:hypothetical protein
VGAANEEHTGTRLNNLTSFVSCDMNMKQKEPWSFDGTESDFVRHIVQVMSYPAVKLMEKPKYQPGNCPLLMDHKGQNGTGDGQQNKNADVVEVVPITHEKDEKASHCWCVLHRRF